MTRYPLVVLFAFVATASPPAAGAEIYKCTDELGNIAYLQLPCPAQKAAPDETADTTGPAADAVVEPDVLPPPAPTSRHPDESLDDCKKRYRDRIDEIDAELGSALSAAQTETYKEQLLALAQQLRACG